MFQNDTMQVVWQYHVEEPVSAAGVLPDHGAVRGSRPLYLVQRDTQPRRSSRNQEAESSLRTWDILNKQVNIAFVVLALARRKPRVNGEGILYSDSVFARASLHLLLLLFAAGILFLKLSKLEFH
jgi:hypothetical protein